ncbi:ABC transporter substrate-binding protein [Halieaceae bacterium IMCC14734]|uniref:ABC transporter substrate-binding protein n=1 Tax=Candidatus Litorirhabdus singularis TaxID=2518993 RepID=A0ABT3TJF4_9GAMM|nr:ABC transporter substrate-binding protein [Candidatus Litorirhabdus singularis]MCX2982451.1 ABC transporter substrate-binding protein [Candidatus Litorirhabdus singularis]
MFDSLMKVIAILAFLAVPVVGAAETAAPSAQQLVTSATDRVMVVVQAAPDYIDEDPERYYAELLVILDEVVDFSGFAKGVMGTYATKSYYQSLSAEGKAQLREHVKSFTQEMRFGLVRTYGKGLLAFGGSRVEVLPTDAEEEKGNKVSVVQLIHGDADEPYQIYYQMRRARSGDWRLRNLIVESINLGQVYRNQFQAAVRDNNGDLKAVIDNWTPEEI